MNAAFERLMLAGLAPLDALRTLGLRLVGVPLSGLLRSRSRRVGLWSVSAVLVALLLTARAPLYLLTLGPLFFGVVHLLADVRYLVVRQHLHERRELVSIVAPLLIAQCWFPSAALALCTTAVAAVCARTTLLRRGLVAGLAVALGAVCALRPALSSLCFAHAHNLVALALWVWWARHERLHVVPALLLFAVGACLILLGALDDAVFEGGALAPSRLALDVDVLADGVVALADPLQNVRWLLFFAFAQSVHYAVWTRLIPEEDRTREGPRSYRASYAALSREFGSLSLSLVTLLAGYVALRGLFEPHLLRTQYLRFALFHGPLELAAATLLVLEQVPLHARGHVCRPT